MNFEIELDYERFLSWEYANMYCYSLEVGYKKGWGMPTIEEMKAIAETNNLRYDAYWTGEHPNDNDCSAVYRISTNQITYESITNRYGIIPTRDVEPLLVEIAPIEYETKLVWHEAKLYCFLLTIDGKVGWRLPTTKEFKAIYLSDNDLKGSYWSSEEYFPRVMSVNMHSCHPSYTLSSQVRNVRPVRTLYEL